MYCPALNRDFGNSKIILHIMIFGHKLIIKYFYISIKNNNLQLVLTKKLHGLNIQATKLCKDTTKTINAVEVVVWQRVFIPSTVQYSGVQDNCHIHHLHNCKKGDYIIIVNDYKGYKGMCGFVSYVNQTQFFCMMAMVNVIHVSILMSRKL